jgi:hypothetical protein
MLPRVLAKAAVIGGELSSVTPSALVPPDRCSAFRAWQFCTMVSSEQIDGRFEVRRAALQHVGDEIRAGDRVDHEPVGVPTVPLRW